MFVYLSEPAPRRVLTLFLCAQFAFLAACSDGSGSPEAANDGVSGLGAPDDGTSRTLAVPGAGNLNTVPVPAAVVEGPVAGAPVLVSTFFPLEPLGYQRSEYFLSGTANAYVNVNELDADGQWQVEASEQSDYRTRIVVIRPSQSENFNGTVFVEWLNTSAGFDSDPQWGMAHTEMIRSGYAWVGVSAQLVGVEALVDGSAAAILPGASNAARYATLFHPGDRFSYDMYSQVAQAIRKPEQVSVLGDLQAQRLIAGGESQSAAYMVTYVNALAPLHALYDGYFIHSRLEGSAPLQGSLLQPTLSTPEVVRVRDDLGTPVLMLQTESDLFGWLNSYPSNQADSGYFRLWEVAGTAHADLYTFLDARIDTGTNPGIAAVVENATPIPGIIECELPVNSGPQHFVVNAAIAALNTWLVEGTAPTRAERLTVADTPPALVRDEHGIVLGGVRTPYVDAPIATLEGEGQPQPDLVLDGSGLTELSLETVDYCFLSGTTKLFDAATLGALYEDNDAYIEAVNTATDEAVSKGFLLPADADLIRDHVANTDIFAL